MNTDTEALKALVAHATELQKQLDDGDGAYPQDYHDIFGKLEAALPALERMLASQTQDMVLVPREPTAEMLVAWQNSDGLIKAYHAMLSAAPVASQMGEPAVLSERELSPWPTYKQLFTVVERGDIEAMAEVNPGIGKLLENFKDGVSSHNQLVEKLNTAAPAAGMDADKIARDIVETYICTKRAENY